MTVYQTFLAEIIGLAVNTKIVQCDIPIILFLFLFSFYDVAC